jgi:hypothetical protein
MNKEGTVGTAMLLAIAAMVGISLQGGPKQAESGRTDRSPGVKRSIASTRNASSERKGCANLQEKLEDFLAIDNLLPPDECFGGTRIDNTTKSFSNSRPGLKFVIALMPDPVHTHSSADFDQSAVAIQEGAQDEFYDFDSSWLPWSDEDQTYALLADQKAADHEKDDQENQPGIILFRRQSPTKSYSDGLIVFVVGEDATHGIHRDQFQNALAWIGALQSKHDTQIENVAILGPSFSGSFPSLKQALDDPVTKKSLDLDKLGEGQQLAIFSGSASSKDAAESFQNEFDKHVVFHSFLQNDDVIIRQFCHYMTSKRSDLKPSQIAIISEDETAYGGDAIRPADSTCKDATCKDKTRNDDSCAEDALKLYYPRDISTLRGAYQTKSLFAGDPSSQAANTQTRSLPTDLADPTGNVHDSIHTYGGNQTPLAQEAILIYIVTALRELHSRYIILRSSTAIDQLFLANFLRRNYPDGRIVILESDLMFIRERGTTGLSGAMTLSTYPHFPLGRDWTEHQNLPASDRTFSSDNAEGSYMALRLLLNTQSINGPPSDINRCKVLEDPKQKRIFVPAVSCGNGPSIPDYSPPFWMLPNQCGEMLPPSSDSLSSCPYKGPATWLSAVGMNQFWPLAALTDPAGESSHYPIYPDTKIWTHADCRKCDPGGLPEMPLGMKIFLIAFVAFSVLHALCCYFGSYTATPVFRAHFASTGDMHQFRLVFIGSCFIAFIAIVAGWGSGIFSTPATGLDYPWFALSSVTFAWLMAWGAILAHCQTSRRLAEDLPKDLPDRPKGSHFSNRSYLASGLFIVTTALFYLTFAFNIEQRLSPDTRVLTYWRAMHLTSGVSPIVPIFSILIGLYIWFWFELHGLALFGPDRPCLPEIEQLAFECNMNKKYFLRMFSKQDAAEKMESTATKFRWKVVAAIAITYALSYLVAWLIAGGVPLRSLGSQNYALVFIVWLLFGCCLSTIQAWRMYDLWGRLRCLLAFLDRLPLRRTMAALNGFSWGSVWKMSGNVLEVRYKVISRQLECMNHNIATLDALPKPNDQGVHNSLEALKDLRDDGKAFAKWYSDNYLEPNAGDLTRFTVFQESVANVSGTLLAQLLVRAWKKEDESLLTAPAKDPKDEAAPNTIPPAKDPHIRNAEEFVCLNYLAFVQNILGRLRTMAMTIIALFIASACAMSTYPFDPRQGLSAVLIVLFAIGSVVIVKVYVEMHRDATLSHVTKTKPGQVGPEFWFKLVGLGLAPVLGLIARIFPDVSDFLFSWLQPGISSLK